MSEPISKTKSEGAFEAIPSEVQPVKVVDILLVEDNLGDARLIREMLADAPECDWRVVQADRLESAIELLSSKHFDLCLLDLNLPDSSALATLEQLVNFFDLPIIVLTGLADTQMGLSALRLGAQDYLVKDQIDEFTLARALRYAVQRFSLEQRYSQMFAASNDAILVIDTEAKRVTDANPTALLLLGYSREELLALPTAGLSDDEDAWRSYLEKVTRRGRGDAELSLRAKSGREIYVDVSASRIKEGRKRSVVLTARDMTEKRYLMKELEHQANHDALTELHNRYALERQFKRLSRRGARKLPNLSLISIDLNDFKRVNDTLGHSTGNELLKKVSERILRVATSKDTVARSGGDEFTLLVQTTRTRNANTVSERLSDALSVPFNLGQNKLHMRVSIGVALLEESAKTFSELMRRADQAMYQAKRAGGGVVFYSEETNARLRERSWVERALREALDSVNNGAKDLELYFQPLACLNCEERPYAEALLRWQHAERGFIAPDLFISIAEETGLILELDRWVIENALQQAALGEFSVAINISPMSLREPDFVAFIQERLAQTSLQPEQITLEVTERVLAHPEWSLTTLQALSDLGLQLVIDDFGTGYSSLDYLFQFPLNGLKVDRSFTAKLIQDEKAELVSRTIVQLAKNLGISAIIEGIEEEAQLDWSRAVGSDRAQGYLIARPLPFTDFLAWCVAEQTDQKAEKKPAPGVSA